MEDWEKATDWGIMYAPPAPDKTGVEGATDLIIASKTATGEEESVASLSIMLLLCVLGATILLGSWLKSRGVTWLHQAGAALLLGIAGGVALLAQASTLGTSDLGDWLVRYGDYLVFDTEFFFLFLLPPIIFESGYALNGEAFFRNLGKIAYFAFPGTLLGAASFGVGMFALGAIGLSHSFKFSNAMMFGSIIGATDPVSVLAIFTDLGVEENLFAVVFGESVLNDAVAVVLYRAFSGMGEHFSMLQLARASGTFVRVFVGSTAIGVGTGLASALFFKRFNLAGGDGAACKNVKGRAGVHDEKGEKGERDEKASVSVGIGSPGPKSGQGGGGDGKNVVGKDKKGTGGRKGTGDPEEAVRGAVLEASVVALFPWIAYMAAEAARLVGIVSILFCGIVMGHYTRRNLSAGGRALTMGAFGLMAQLSETFVFIYIGASVFLALPKYFSTAVWAVAMCFASRYVAVFPGVSLINAHTGTELAARRARAEVGANAPTPAGSTPGGEQTCAGILRQRAASAVEHSLASVFHSGGPMPGNHARMLWFSGLRGAMAFALALEAAATRGDDGRAILTGVLGAVVFTTLVVGGSTTRALAWLGISTGEEGGRGRRTGGSVGRQPSVGQLGPGEDRLIDSRTIGGPGDRFSDDRSSTDDDDAEAGTRALVTSGRSDGGTHHRGGDRRLAGGSRGNLADVSAPVRVRAEDVDYMEHARTIDERYLTPLFTLQKGDRDGAS
uniref:Cation/H+ exchanger transmembrane domain-containing protein n=1 Tax=Micromonas pusilla TaxID=38833 RepID=A0A7S0IGM3_MICPS